MSSDWLYSDADNNYNKDVTGLADNALILEPFLLLIAAKSITPKKRTTIAYKCKGGLNVKALVYNILLL